MFQEDLASNNLQGLICHKTQPSNFLEISQESSSIFFKTDKQTLISFPAHQTLLGYFMPKSV